MKSQWVIWLLLVVGLAYVAGNPCDPTHVTECYEDLAHYETLAFPLYGEDEIKLEETCGNINMSFECVQDYTDNCDQSPDCGKECRQIIGHIRSFVQNTGLQGLAAELCDIYSAVRETYIENYPCLDKNKDAYAACHNDSQLSSEYMLGIRGPEAIPIRCCYFSWYNDCFTNITRDHCGANATFFVSYAMHKLIGQASSQLCSSTHISCSRPPLPDDNEGSKTGLDKSKPGQIDNDIDDNSIDHRKGNSVSMISSSISVLLSSVIVVLSRKRFCE